MLLCTLRVLSKYKRNKLMFFSPHKNLSKNQKLYTPYVMPSMFLCGKNTSLLWLHANKSPNSALKLTES